MRSCCDLAISHLNRKPAAPEKRPAADSDDGEEDTAGGPAEPHVKGAGGETTKLTRRQRKKARRMAEILQLQQQGADPAARIAPQRTLSVESAVSIGTVAAKLIADVKVSPGPAAGAETTEKKKKVPKNKPIKHDQRQNDHATSASPLVSPVRSIFDVDAASGKKASAAERLQGARFRMLNEQVRSMAVLVLPCSNIYSTSTALYNHRRPCLRPLLA